MKKMFSTIIAIMLALCLNAIPVFAATYRIPEDIQNVDTGGKYTVSYNASNKKLTYKSSGSVTGQEGNILGTSYGGAVAAGLLYKNSVSQKTQNEMIAYNEDALYMAMSDIVRSGKVNTIRVESTTQTETLIFEYNFKRNKNGQVVSCECAGDSLINGESSGWVPSGRYYDFAYDSNGDLKSVSKEGRMMPLTTTTFNFSNGKLTKLVNKSEIDGSSSMKVTVNSAGHPTNIGDTAFTYDSNGRLASVKGEFYTTKLNYDNNGDLLKASVSYQEAKTTYTTTVKYSYMDF